MPNVDSCQPQIIAALEKLGFRITNAPFTLPTSLDDDGRYLYADLRAERINNGQIERMIVVEVKCFPAHRPFLEELYHAIGQYQAYQAVMDETGLTEDLYLALPVHALEIIVNEAFMQRMIKTANASLIVVDLISEEVTEWIR